MASSTLTKINTEFGDGLVDFFIFFHLFNLWWLSFILLRCKYRHMQLKKRSLTSFLLRLPGMELTFFVAACVVLCFAFVAKATLVTHQCFGCCWTTLTQHQGFLSQLTQTQRSIGWGCVRGWKGTQLGQLSPAGQRDIPYHTRLCSEIKAQGNGQDVGTFVMAFVFPINHYAYFQGEWKRSRVGVLLLAGVNPPHWSFWLFSVVYYLPCLLCISFTASKLPLQWSSKSNPLSSFSSWKWATSNFKLILVTKQNHKNLKKTLSK